MAEARQIEEEKRQMESRKTLWLEELREELKQKRAHTGSWLLVKMIKMEKGTAGMGRKARMDGNKDGDKEEEEDQDKDKEKDMDKDEDKDKDKKEEEREQDVNENNNPKDVEPQRGISSDMESDRSVNRLEQSATPLLPD